MRRILVTGGSGFIGTNLIEHYLRLGDEIVNLDRVQPKNPAHIEYWRELDILQFDDLASAFTEFQPDLVMHMAARTDLDGRSLDDYECNTRGVEHLIRVIGETPSVRRTIFASTRLVCRIDHFPADEFDYCPTTYYGESKVIGEELVRDLMAPSAEWSIVRPTSIWGPWFGIPYNPFFRAVMSGRYIHPGKRRIEKSFGYIGNTVYQLEKLCGPEGDGLLGHATYLGDYPPLEVLDWAETIARSSGGSRVRQVPVLLMKGIALGGDLLKLTGLMKNPPLTSFRLDNLTTGMVLPLEPLEQMAGPLPFTLSQGVEETLRWMRDCDRVDR